jgi:hypothetical protein
MGDIGMGVGLIIQHSARLTKLSTDQKLTDREEKQIFLLIYRPFIPLTSADKTNACEI